MKFLVTGASGFLGKAVAKELIERGHEVHALVRRLWLHRAWATLARVDGH